MRISAYLAATSVIFLSAPPALASADHYLKIASVAGNPGERYIYLKVQSTGDLDGDSEADGAVARITCVGSTLRAADYHISARDVASGQVSGKGTHNPSRSAKDWGPASPQLLAMKPTYDVKTNNKGRLAPKIDGWSPINLSKTDGLCAAARQQINKSKSNVKNN